MQANDQVWDVIPLLPLPARGPQSFSYRGPDPAAGGGVPEVEPGTLVRIPLGPRSVQGIVRNLVRARRVRHRLKPITKVLSRVPLFTPQELSALERLAECSLEPLASLTKAASLVREPLKATGVRRILPKRRFRRRLPGVRVRVEPLAEALPTRIEGHVLVLTPEAVIAQEVLQALQQRGIPTAFFSQGLPLRERRAIVERLGQDSPLAVVATHAGVFLPFSTLTEIIVAEAALPSHRQWDLHPRYDARVAAFLLARNHQARLTFQSTLPSLDLHRLQPQERWSAVSRHITVIPRSPTDPLLSSNVLSAVRTTADAGGTTFLFHDIVGTERVFACTTCGSVLRCQACAGMLERSGSLLRCRVCGVPAGRAPQFCPQCKSPHIGPRRIGTATLAGQLQQAFPSTPVLRADRETLPRGRPGTAPRLPKGSIVLGTERAFAALAQTTFDQIVVLDADRVLEGAAYDAAERFALLVTRLKHAGKPGSSMLLQTTHPHLSVVRAIAGAELGAWIAEELSDRELLGYPPFAALLHLQKSIPASPRAARAGAESVRASAARTAKQLVEKLRIRHRGLAIGYRIVGTSPLARVEILLRGSLANLHDVLLDIPPGWETDPQVPLSMLR